MRGFLHLAHIILTSTLDPNGKDDQELNTGSSDKHAIHEDGDPYDISTYATSSNVLHAKVQTQVQQQLEIEQLEHYLQPTRSYKGKLSEKDTKWKKHSSITSKTYEHRP